ncbi:hypothetical protein FOZ62_005494, partial [Perkinsus olseni]
IKHVWVVPSRSTKEMIFTAARKLVHTSRPAVTNSAKRTFFSRSRQRMAHNLEDHFDLAEYMMKMHNPMSEYLYWIAGFVSGLHGILPLLHSNYYFSGMFLPRDNDNTQLCDDSW